MALPSPDRAGTDRMEALSDGVFAIVLTLLVLQFRVPDVSADAAARELPSALVDQRALFVSYLLSFVVVGIYWIVHHNLLGYVERHDRVLLYLNLLFLLAVSFLPFPTELLGIYGVKFTWMLYAANLAIIGFILALLWHYAVVRRFTAVGLQDRDGALVTGRIIVPPIVFGCSIAVATVDLTVAFFTPLAIGPLQVLWVRYYRRRAVGS